MIPLQFVVGILLFILGGFIGNSNVVFDWFNATSLSYGVYLSDLLPFIM